MTRFALPRFLCRCFSGRLRCLFFPVVALLLFVVAITAVGGIFCARPSFAESVAYVQDQPTGIPVGGDSVPASADEQGIDSAALSHGEKHSGLPQLKVETYPGQMFWLLITFFSLFVIFSRKILPDIAGILSVRASKIEGDLSAAAQLREESERVRREYDHALDEARRDALASIIRAEEEIEKNLGDTISAFHDRAEEQIHATEKRMESLRESLLPEIHAEISTLCLAINHKVAGLDSAPQKVAAAVKEAIREKEEAA